MNDIDRTLLYLAHFSGLERGNHRVYIVEVDEAKVSEVQAQHLGHLLERAQVTAIIARTKGGNAISVREETK